MDRMLWAKYKFVLSLSEILPTWLTSLLVHSSLVETFLTDCGAWKRTLVRIAGGAPLLSVDDDLIQYHALAWDLFLSV